MQHDPIALFQRELARAEEGGAPLPDAVALATSGADGSPSVRMVLLKDVDARGFVFYTNLGSRKARELGDRPRAALCSFWASIEVQARVEGTVERVSDAEADAYFATRPRGSQLGAWASRQSEPIGSREELLARAALVEARFAGGPVPRPPFWSGFRLVPERIELWYGKPDRLHERRLYERDGDGWRLTTLQP